MDDVSPGVAISTFAGVLLGGLKVIAEVIKWRNGRRLQRAFTESTPPVEPGPAPLPVQHSAAVQLEAKQIELLRARYQIEELEQTLRRMRMALDEAAQEQARTAAALSAERAANAQLLDEMAELRRTGGGTDDRTDDRASASGARRGVHGLVGGGRGVHAPRGLGDREGDR